jgi:hypothetical protein
MNNCVFARVRTLISVAAFTTAASAAAASQLDERRKF